MENPSCRVCEEGNKEDGGGAQLEAIWSGSASQKRCQAYTRPKDGRRQRSEGCPGKWTVMGWVVSSPNSSIEVPQNVMVFGDKAFNRWLSQMSPTRVGLNSVWLLSLTEGNLDTQNRMSKPRGKNMWRHSKVLAVCRPREEASEETKPASTWILDF